MTMPLIASNDLVVIAWLKTVPNIDPTKVATVLPEDETTWGETGFVQARTVAGAADLYTHTGRPVVQVDCWAVRPNTAKPLWNVASLLAQHVLVATRDEVQAHRTLTLPTGYPNARVLEVYPLVEPHRIESDAGGYARFRMDLQFIWAQVPS